MRLFRVAVWCSVFVLLWLLAVLASDVQLTVSPTYSLCEPTVSVGCASTLTATAHLRADERNRVVVFTLYSQTTEAGYATATLRQVDAESRYCGVVWRGVPADDYLATATLYRSDGTTQVCQVPVRIRGAL